jgi:methyl-accepting chemotaxis protein
MNEAVTNPYRYSYSFNPDETVLMTSICVPIIVDGVFKGVAGVDVSLDIYQKLIER